MPAPTYLHRLRLEGAALIACGALGTVVLLIATAQARRGPVSTAVQLIVVAALLLWLGPRGVRRSIVDSREQAADEIGSGEPTPLWHIVAIVIALTLLAGELGGWDVGLRVTIGCMLVGALQALVLSRIVSSAERRTGRTYYRVAGSRILTGTRLGHTEHDADSATQPQA